MEVSRVIVDENDAVIGAKLKSELSHGHDIYRVSAAWVVNATGQFLLARRSPADSNEAGKWGPSVAGTVEQGESYDDNIRKELSEEIGLQDIEPQTGPKIFIDGQRRYFAQWYYVPCDKAVEDFKLQSEEVAAVRWIGLSELKEELADHPNDYIAGFHQGLEVANMLYKTHYKS